MKKYNLTHGREDKIAQYIVDNNIELSSTNAYDTIVKTFKDDPILERNGTEERDITWIVARNVECDESTIKRINLKKEVIQKNKEEEQRKKNIEKSNIDTKPDVDKLVENLYKLNIVDARSYLALVCFLMQLKYTRNGLIENDDKTCVFFNGVARNGKSATAKAICTVEAQYGEVFKAQSGKLLESKHEEQVWKSHLNFFDEVKPTDIDRELLLTIVNGGPVELNPKNKKPYTYNVNTNNIFTSNDQISLRQRRVSVVKFGDRLNGRPMKHETLVQIIVDIMNSLPDFARYDAIYEEVSYNNATRYNPLAAQDVLTYIASKIEYTDDYGNPALRKEVQFAAHNIFSCIKNLYNKQIIPAERKEAIKDFIENNVEDGRIQIKKYINCSTIHYIVTSDSYIAMSEEFHKLNTKDEDTQKVPQKVLLNLFSPYFTTATLTEDKIQSDDTPPKMRAFEYHKYTDLESYSFFDNLVDKLKQLIQDYPKPTDEQISDIINEYITPGVCNFKLTYIMETIYQTIDHLSQEIIDLIKERYKSLNTWPEEDAMQDLQECDKFLQSVTKNEEENIINNSTTEVANDNILAMDDVFDLDIPF